MPLGGILSIGGGILGSIFSSGDKAKAQQLAQEAYQQLADMGLPPDLSKAIVLQKFQQAGTMSPDMEAAVNLGVSQVSQIKEDPTLRNAQSKALQQLQQVSTGGLRPEDRAAYNQLRNQTEAAMQGKAGQIQQQFQSRGQGGQGAELAAQLSNSQAGANTLSSGGDQLSADASKRALEALSSSGQLAGQVRGQDFSNALAKSNAADEFAKFNAQNSMAIQARNIAAKNAAQMANLQNAQNVSNMNVGQGNEELQRQNAAKQQYYNSLMSRQQAISGAKLGQANIYAGQAANTAQNFQNIGSGAGQAVTSYNNNQQQQSNYKDLLNRMYPQKQTPTPMDKTALDTNQWFNS